MKVINYNWSNIIFEEYKYENNLNLKNFLDNKNYIKLIDFLNINVNLVLWWDWTMLSALNCFFSNNLPFLWINFWTKGFLLNDNIYDNITYSIFQYPIFEMNIQDKTFYSFNEFDIRSSDWKILTLDISINNCTSISISWDWVIISSPLWSTWYNSSLGWPIIPHDLDAFVVTSKAPWKPKWQQPILLKDNTVLELRNSWRINNFEVFSDWKSIFKSNKKEFLVIKKSNIFFNLIIFDDYLKKWNSKIFLEQWFKRKRIS